MHDIWIFLVLLYFVCGLGFTVEGLFLGASVESKELSKTGIAMLIFFLPVVIPTMLMGFLFFTIVYGCCKIKIFKE